MVKEIVWTETAIRDRLLLFQFWFSHNKSPLYSIQLESLFNEAAKLIADFPQIGVPTDHPGIKVKVIRNYKLFYRDLPGRIEILRVWDTRREPSSLKLS